MSQFDRLTVRKTLLEQFSDLAQSVRVLELKKQPLDPFIRGGDISPTGALLTWVSNFSYRMEAGYIDVYGEELVFDSAITRSSLVLSANTLYYVYVWRDRALPALEESTTVPVWNAELNYYQKTDDPTRRCIGFFATNASSAIIKFLHTVTGGRSSEIVFTDGTLKVLVTAGTVTANWQSFSLASFVPAHATHGYFMPVLNSTTLNDEGIVGLSPIDMGSVLPVASPYPMRIKSFVANLSTYYGYNWLPISVSQTYYYRLTHALGTGMRVYVYLQGARFIR